ncbi:unnamed protein product [Orchesella dallaii]|uniref:Uncharacterized protein n=1 Tax=Orchesella dallaii TaxID=48710 RepID=A0ABP1PTK8_9HEXA
MISIRRGLLAILLTLLAVVSSWSLPANHTEPAVGNVNHTSSSSNRTGRFLGGGFNFFNLAGSGNLFSGGGGGGSSNGGSGGFGGFGQSNSDFGNVGGNHQTNNYGRE